MLWKNNGRRSAPLSATDRSNRYWRLRAAWLTAQALERYRGASFTLGAVS